MAVCLCYAYFQAESFGINSALLHVLSCQDNRPTGTDGLGNNKYNSCEGFMPHTKIDV